MYYRLPRCTGRSDRHPSKRTSQRVVLYRFARRNQERECLCCCNSRVPVGSTDIPAWYKLLSPNWLPPQFPSDELWVLAAVNYKFKQVSDYTAAAYE